MPVIHTHVSVNTSQEQRDRLKAAFGQAIALLPGKSEGWLLCVFDDNKPMYFGGDDSAPVAFIEVNAFGRSKVPAQAWERLTQAIMPAVSQELGIPQDRIYIRYLSTENWGWNGGNF